MISYLLFQDRNKCFQQAVNAYRSGKKKLARDMSRKGREAHRSMKQLHRRAALAIFEKRNPNLTPNSINPGKFQFYFNTKIPNLITNFINKGLAFVLR